MTVVGAAKTILEADTATLVAAATGGIFDLDEAGRLGLNRTTTPGIVDSNGILKPCVLLKSRSAVSDGILADDADQSHSLIEMLEVWFYEDDGYTVIDAMRDRVYTLLHAVQLTSTFICYWSGDIKQQRDEALDASMERSEFMVRRIRAG